jgi:beta-mannosidase
MTRARILGFRAARPLDGIWEIAALAPGRATQPRDLDVIQPQWIACDGPLPAAAALRAAGQWDIDQARDFDAEDWWYRCRFVAPAPAIECGAVRLRFEGLATVADVWLNGHHILHSESMFVARAVPIERGLSGDNELVFRFHALSPLLAHSRPRPKWRTKLVSHQSLRWHRTSLLGRMPAWCPPVAPVGPWRPILIETSPLVVEAADLRVELVGGDGCVSLSLAATRPSGAIVDGTLTVGEWNAPLTCARSSDGQSILSGTVRVPRPDCWWPHTHGTAALYQVRASIRTGSTRNTGNTGNTDDTANGGEETVDLGRIGFRTIDVDRSADGNGFGLVVNGTAVFCRGVCWTPIDLASLSAGPTAYREALERLRDGGMNMIRVGGTMTYETDAFHDLCDELGILVWQDFMFANLDYPLEDDAFAHLVTLEVTQTLEALQSRPSLAVVCGGSEVEQQAAMLGLPAARQPGRLIDERFRDLVATMAPGTAWQRSSPTGGTFPFQLDSGVSHYYGVGAYQRPFDDARRAGVRFASECLAFSNVPEAAAILRALPEGETPGPHPRWKARVPRDAGVGWDFEDVRDHYVERLFGISPVDLRARDPERYLALGRVATGEAMLRTFAEWRRPGSTCRGGLVWFARDLWPGAGWGILDAAGEPKSAYWYLKRALAPVALLSADEGLNGLWLHVVNDTIEPIEASLRIALYRNGIVHGRPARTMLSIPARGYRSIHADAVFDGFLDLTYAYRFGPPAHDVVAATLRDRTTDALRAVACHFPNTLPAAPVTDLGLTARVEPIESGYALVLDTERFAHAVAIDIDGWIPDDNYLHIEPGETRRVGLRPTTSGAAPHGTVLALNGRSAVPTLAAKAVNAG